MIIITGMLIKIKLKTTYVTSIIAQWIHQTEIPFAQCAKSSFTNSYDAPYYVKLVDSITNTASEINITKNERQHDPLQTKRTFFYRIDNDYEDWSDIPKIDIFQTAKINAMSLKNSTQYHR
jgi:hypothetical protein